MTQSTKGGRAELDKPGNPGGPRRGQASTSQVPMPGWTNGLRELYDQVVDEKLPDSFHDLLARLDDKS